MEDLKFSLKLKEIPVKLTGVDGVERPYTLVELTGESRDAWLDDYNKRRVIKDGKDTGELSNLAGFQAAFVSSCLYDDKNKNVLVETIQTFPSNVITSLYDAAQKLSGLDKGAEKASKKELEAKGKTGTD